MTFAPAAGPGELLLRVSLLFGPVLNDPPRLGWYLLDHLLGRRPTAAWRCWLDRTVFPMTVEEATVIPMWLKTDP
jgi:hypothetical protein